MIALQHFAMALIVAVGAVSFLDGEDPADVLTMALMLAMAANWVWHGVK